VPVTELPVREKGMCCQVPLPADGAWASQRARLLKALADPGRLLMLWSLRRAGGPMCVCDFTAPLGLGQPTVSHHMARLRAAGLVESEKRGVWTYYRLRDDLSEAATRLLEAVIGDAPGPPSGGGSP
jgi:DNA-binding transcriptional ArsR family regulator